PFPKLERPPTFPIPAAGGLSVRWSLLRRLSGAGSAREQWRGFAVIVVLFLALLIVALATSWSAIELVNETRAYAAGEGLYSKAQKMAVLDLHRYAVTGAESDYREFQTDIGVPLGDHAGRLAL